jgi:glucose/arabinose dehydrogenase
MRSFSTQRPRPRTLALVATAALLAACSNNDNSNSTGPSPSIQCDADNGGITLPQGFCAVVVADVKSGSSPAAARHMVVTPNGDLFVAINPGSSGQPPFGIIGLRDTNGDGRADQQSTFSSNLGGSGIAWGNGVLYFGANDRIVRYQLPSGQLAPSDQGAIVVSGLPSTGDHVSKTLVLADAQRLFVNIGSSGNSCQVANRIAQSPGIFPCTDLPIRAGVWLFDPSVTNQTEASGRRFATGYRNLVALAFNSANSTLYAVQQGRDMLADNFPQFFNDAQAAVLPAEEFVRVADGSDNGWPYCFYDAVFAHAKLLAPEYGGDGHLTSSALPAINCATMNQPLATFGAHWSPDGMTFYTGNQFPDRYRNGAFVAFHGGFDRAPLPNEGFQVQFVPMGADGTPSGPAETFANGFAGSSSNLPADAVHRPVGVTVGPDGSLYVSDDKGGRIWRIIYRP